MVLSHVRRWLFCSSSQLDRYEDFSPESKASIPPTEARFGRLGPVGDAAHKKSTQISVTFQEEPRE